ncbi:MAG TPA: DUF1295 domain-containing protein, partial [bacterium]
MYSIDLLGVLLILGVGFAFSWMMILWLIQLKTKNAGIGFFGSVLSIVLLTLFYYFEGNGWENRKDVALLMASLWGFRLSLFILFIRVLSSAEDPRYQQLRKKWEKLDVNQKFLEFFEFQGLLAFVFSIPFLLACFNPLQEWNGFEKMGSFLWAFAFLGEVISDWQLYRFKSKSSDKGKACRVGFWNYSRHPNYFFEWLVWCAIALFAFGSPFGYVALVCPLLIFYLIFRVTGIPAVEAQALRVQG